jgi:sugar O-acyltransferase (sialic acid O-acetyltransferase NeuD family)
MLRESGLGEPAAIFDDALPQPDFPTSAEFVNELSTLKLKLQGLSHFVVCIGGTHGLARWKTAGALQSLGLKPLTLIHRCSFVEPTATLGDGGQIMPGAVVHKFTNVGEQCIVNTSATVDHECKIGHGVHIMGSAAVAGKVIIGDFASIGTNATILPDISIGEGAIVGAGAVVTKDVGPYTVVVGVPARYQRECKPQYSDSVLKSILAF